MPDIWVESYCPDRDKHTSDPQLYTATNVVTGQ